MGCGASKDASANAPAEPEKKGKKGHGEGKDAAFDTGAVDAAAAVTTAVGTAALVAGAANDGARGAMGEIAGAAGNALLAFGKELPWVAPIAFLVAGVVQASADVHALKHDAKIFCANVRSVENVMAEAGRKGHLAKVEETCMALQYEMEEGLAFCHKLKTQYFITQLVMSGRHCQKFKDISDSIHRQVTIIAAAASIDTHDIVRSEFEQGKKLQAKIAELGGADAVAADPALKAQCREFLSASDAMIVSAVDEVQRAVQLEAAKSQKKMDLLMEENRQQREEARQQTKMLEDQVSKLTSMMEVLLKTRVEQALGGEGVDLSQDDGKARPELEKAMDEQMRAENVRDLESRMPMPANEDRRVEVVQRMGFSAEDVQDLVGDADFAALAHEAQDFFGGDVQTMVSSIDATRQTALSFAQDERSHVGDGFWLPKIGTSCQHVIKKNDVIQSNGSMAEMPEIPRLNFPEMMALAQTDVDPNAEMSRWMPLVGQTMEYQANGGDMSELIPNQDVLPGTKPLSYGQIWSFAQMMAKGDDAPLHYTGAPIKIEGQTVGTFCVLDGKHRDDIDADAARRFADRAALMIQEKAIKRGFGK